MMLADDLSGVQVVAPMIYDTSSSDEEAELSGESDDETREVRDITIVYNKREAYFRIPELVARRMSRRIAHQPSSDTKQKCCVWCCRLDHSSGQKHSRHGRKTTWYCPVCNVSLCKVKRYNERSCFILFHVSHTLFDPCCVEAQQMMHTPRRHSNRYVLQPHRRRADDSDGDDDSDAASLAAIAAPDENMPAAHAAVASQHNDSFVPLQGDGQQDDDLRDEEMKDDEDFHQENGDSDDDDDGGERRAVRSRSPGITIPKRSTRQRH
jgi:hypothetical protein